MLASKLQLNGPVLGVVEGRGCVTGGETVDGGAALDGNTVN